MKKINYKIWPLGKLKKHQQRNELSLLKQKGYTWKDPWDAVELFEDKVANDVAIFSAESAILDNNVV